MMYGREKGQVLLQHMQYVKVPLHTTVYLHCSLKGQCREILSSDFFHLLSSFGPLVNTPEPINFFLQNSRDISNARSIIGINEADCTLTTVVVDISGKFSPISWYCLFNQWTLPKNRLHCYVFKIEKWADCSLFLLCLSSFIYLLLLYLFVSLFLLISFILSYATLSLCLLLYLSLEQ